MEVKDHGWGEGQGGRRTKSGGGVRNKLRLKRKGSEAFAKVEKKAPPSQPGLEPGSSAYAADALPFELLGPAHVQISSVTPSHHFASPSQHKPHPRPT